MRSTRNRPQDNTPHSNKPSTPTEGLDNVQKIFSVSICVIVSLLGLLFLFKEEFREMEPYSSEKKIWQALDAKRIRISSDTKQVIVTVKESLPEKGLVILEVSNKAGVTERIEASIELINQGFIKANAVMEVGEIVYIYTTSGDYPIGAYVLKKIKNKEVNFFLISK